MRITKRTFLGGAGAAAAAAFGVALLGRGSEAAAETFEVKLAPDRWKRRLGAERDRVLRQTATVSAGPSTINNEHGRGTFLCAGCDLHAYRSQDKIESDTGRPSFIRPI